MKHIYNVRFDNGEDFDVLHSDSVGAICVAVKLRNTTRATEDGNPPEAGAGLRLSSRNVVAVLRYDQAVAGAPKKAT